MSARAAVQYGRVLPAAALAVGLIGLLRLGRQFPAAADSPGLLIPFLLPVLALALEAGSLVALSVSALLLVRQAPAAAFVVGLRRSLPLVALWVATLAAAQLLPRGTERPGALANDLIERARRGCGEGTPQVPIPLLGLTMRCTDPPRVEGPMPGVAAIQLGMRDVRFSDDLRRVSITGLELSAKRALSIKLRASTATIAGLPSWTRSPRLSPLTRFLTLGGIGACLLLGALGLWAGSSVPIAEARSRWWRLAALLLGGAPGIAAAAVVLSLDQQQSGPALYGSSALAGVGVLLALRLLARRAPQLLGSLRGF